MGSMLCMNCYFNLFLQLNLFLFWIWWCRLFSPLTGFQTPLSLKWGANELLFQFIPSTKPIYYLNLMLSSFFIPDRVPNPVRDKKMSGKMPTENHCCRTGSWCWCTVFYWFISLKVFIIFSANLLDSLSSTPLLKQLII